MDNINVNKALLNFWDKAFAMTEEDMAGMREQARGVAPEELAPSEKLAQAAASLGACSKALDYGCGNGWAAVIAAKSGCASVTAVDMAEGAVSAARFTAEIFGAEVDCEHIDESWLGSVPQGEYDGIVCSNVLDVVPPETAGEIIEGLASAAAPGASVIIGLNYYISEETAKAKGIELEDGRCLFSDGILRLVSRTDGEWEELFKPFFTVERLEHFAWPGEEKETRRLFYLKKN